MIPTWASASHLARQRVGLCRTAMALLLGLSVFAAQAAEPPKDLRCEWRVEPTDVRDPCPEFYWEGRKPR